MLPCSHREDMYRLCICHLVIWSHDHYSSPSPRFGLKMQNICLHLRQSWVYNYLYCWTDMEMQSNRYFCLLSLIVSTYIWLFSFVAIMNELITPSFMLLLSASPSLVHFLICTALPLVFIIENAVCAALLA